MGYEWDFAIVFRDFDLLILGLVNTLKVTGLAILFDVPLGLFLALLRLFGSCPIKVPVGFLIEFLRSTPPIAQLFWFFFAMPILIGVEIDPFGASVLTFSLQSSAFFAEVFRGGIISIDQGQWEAAKALNLNFFQTLRLVILPQAVKFSVAPTIGFLIQIIKGTSLCYIIGFQDLMLIGKRWANSPVPGSEPFIIFPIMALLYFCLCYPLARLAKHIEKKTII